MATHRQRGTSLVATLLMAAAYAACRPATPQPNAPQPNAPPTTTSGAGSGRSGRATAITAMSAATAAPLPASPSATAPTPTPKLAVEVAHAPPCEQAAALIARAQKTLAAGWLRRSERLLDRADNLCPARSANNTTAMRSQLQQARTTSGNASQLWSQAQAARSSGNTAQGRLLASVAAARFVKASGTEVALLDMSAGIQARAISDEGHWVAATNEHGLIVFNDLLSPHRYFKGIATTGQVVFSANATRIAAIDKGSVHVWDIASGKQLQTLSWANQHFAAIGFLAQGKQLVAVSDRFSGDQLHLFDIATGDAIAHRKVTNLSRGGVMTVSPKGNWIAVRTQNATLTLLHSKSLTPLRVLLPPAKPAKPNTRKWHRLKLVAPSPSGARIAALLSSGRLLVWDTANGKLLLDQHNLSSWFHGTIAFNANEERVFVPKGSFGRTLVEVEISTGIERRAYQAAVNNAHLATAAPRMVADDGGELQLIEFGRKAEVIARRSRARHRIEAMVGGPAQLALAFESRDRRRSQMTIAWWDGRRRQHRGATLPGYTASLAFSATGNQLAAATGHDQITLLDVATAAPTALPKVDVSRPSLAVDVHGTVWAMDGSSKTTLHAFRPQDDAWVVAKELPHRSAWTRLSTDGHVAVVIPDKDQEVLRMVTSRAADVTIEAFPKLDKKDGALAMSGDGRWLYLASKNRLMRRSLKDANAAPTSLIDPCDARDATASYDGGTVMVDCGYDTTHIIQGDKVTKYKRFRVRSRTLLRDGTAWFGTNGARVYAARTDTPNRRITLDLNDHPDSTLIRSPDGHYEIAGPPSSFDEDLACVIGTRVFPLALCEDHLYEDDLLTRVLMPEP